jgi:phosphomannomutase
MTVSPLQNNPVPSHRFNPVALREYDVRGIVGEQITETDAYYLGRAFGTHVVRLGGTKICVGYDGRLTSPALHEQLVRGLVECGLHVDTIGLCPTPMLYFTLKDRLFDAGIMVTGSHNAAAYNGFKMSLQNGPVYGDMIQQLGTLAERGDFETGTGAVRDIDVKADYIARLIKDFEKGRPLKVAWDISHGAAGAVIHDLIAQLPGEHILLNDTVDGTFPAHPPDPTVDRNLDALRRAVTDNQCNLGIAFDGDADRIGAIDEKGNILRCDALLTLYARDVLDTHPAASIIADVKCSQTLFDDIARMGGTPIMWKTGHSLIKAKMAETNAPLAGELSGHIFFNDKYYGYDDALYCAIRLFNILAGEDKPLSSYFSHLPPLLSTPEQRMAVDEAEKFSIVPRILDNMKDSAAHINDIDGIRVSTPEGWWLIRPSNTEAALVIRMEASSLEALEKMKDTVTYEIDRARHD